MLQIVTETLHSNVHVLRYWYSIHPYPIRIDRHRIFHTSSCAIHIQWLWFSLTAKPRCLLNYYGPFIRWARSIELWLSFCYFQRLLLHRDRSLVLEPIFVSFDFSSIVVGIEMNRMRPEN